MSGTHALLYSFMKIISPSVGVDEINQDSKILGPLDIDLMISQGILEKNDDWYKILDDTRLPADVWIHIQTENRDGHIRFPSSLLSPSALY